MTQETPQDGIVILNVRAEERAVNSEHRALPDRPYGDRRGIQDIPLGVRAGAGGRVHPGSA